MKFGRVNPSWLLLSLVRGRKREIVRLENRNGLSPSPHQLKIKGNNRQGLIWRKKYWSKLKGEVSPGLEFPHSPCYCVHLPIHAPSRSQHPLSAYLSDVLCLPLSLGLSWRGRGLPVYLVEGYRPQIHLQLQFTVMRWSESKQCKVNRITRPRYSVEIFYKRPTKEVGIYIGWSGSSHTTRNQDENSDESQSISLSLRLQLLWALPHQSH